MQRNIHTFFLDLWIILDSVHQGVDKAFRRASITFCVTYNSQWASPTARCGLDRAARSVTVASRRWNLCTSLCTRLWYWLLIDRYPTSGACRSIYKTSTILHSDSKIPWNSQNHQMSGTKFSYYSRILGVSGTDSKVPCILKKQTA